MKRLDGIYRRPQPALTAFIAGIKVMKPYGGEEPTTLPNLYETINYLDKAIEQHRG